MNKIFLFAYIYSCSIKKKKIFKIMINTFYYENNLCGLKRSDFQRTIDGKDVDLFILKNDNGAEMAITNYGGALLAIMVPDKDGKLANVIQGHDTLDKVIHSPEPFLSTLIGRYGNRIAKGKFQLGGEEYQLTINNGPNALHGGPTGFHARIWDAEQTSKQSVTLSYLSQDGEEGFPGNLHVQVIYTFTNQNEFILTYTATTDRTTLVNLTHHAFFSLSGVANPTPSVENNILTINADFYTPMDEVSIPTGEILKVADTPMDFRTPHTVGSRINEPFQQLIYGNGYDHNWVLNTKGDLSQVAAKLTSPISGITLEVYTNEPGIQVYTGNFLDGTVKGKKGITYNQRASVCLETQHYPDSPNKAQWPSVVLEPGQIYNSECVFKFSVEK